MRLAIGILLACGVAACDEHVAALATVSDAALTTGWTAIPAGTANLNAISGVSESSLWVVGDRGTIGHWNGTQLSWETSGTTANLRGVFALSATTAYAVGDNGTILQRQATGSWQQVGKGVTGQVLTAVWADTTRIVAVGSSGTFVLGGVVGGAKYQVLPVTDPATKNPVVQNLLGVTGSPGGVVTAVGALGVEATLQPGAMAAFLVPLCTPMACINNQGTFSKQLSAATVGPNGAYFVGQQGSVFAASTSGQNATGISGCPGTALRAVSATGSSVWIAGWDGTICEITATGAVSFPFSDARWFNGIYAASATSLWVVGASGTLLHGFPNNPDGGAPDASVLDGGS